MGRTLDETDIGSWPVARQINYHRCQMEAEMLRAAKAAEDAYRAKHSAAGSLRTYPQMGVYRARPKGFSDLPVELVESFLRSALHRAQTNAAIVKGLAYKWQPFPVSKNIMSRPFTEAQAKKLALALNNAGTTISIREHNTLGKLKLALRAHFKRKVSGRIYEVSIAFNDQEVIIDNKSYPVSRHAKGYLRFRPNRQWLRCDVLEEILR